jgi:serine/threonine protein phosphatase PrpC
MSLSMLTVAACTDTGRVRETNEDAFLCDPDLGVLAVADGMGGHNAGDVASRLALQSLFAFLLQSAQSSDFTWPCAYDPKQPPNANRLNAAFRVANGSIFTKASRDPQLSGMGTTMVAALIDGPTMNFASVGDSRLYHLRKQQLQQLTKDDSWVSALARDTDTDESSFKDHPMRHVLTNVVGGRAELKLSLSQATLEDQDILLLCSDGLYRGLPEPVISTILGQLPDLQSAVDQLVKTAVECDGADNISAVVARYSAA